MPTVAFSNYKTTLDSSSSYPQGSESNGATRNDWTSTAQTETSAGTSAGKGSPRAMKRTATAFTLRAQLSSTPRTNLSGPLVAARLARSSVRRSGRVSTS